MALARVLRDPRVTTTLIRASSPGRIRESVGVLANHALSADELAEIDQQPGTGVAGPARAW